jgi:acyl-CoA dehydrogenase
MQSPAAPYMDLIMGGTGLLPIKTDALRQLVMYGNENPEEGDSIAQSTAKRRPVKYALTAMGLAAISSGEGGRETVMQKYLPEILKGRLFCYAITEPGAGTNTNKISTKAIDEGDHFRINGQKTFISAADTSYYMVVIAKVIRDGKDNGVGTFIMETATNGIEMSPLDIAVLGERPFSIYFDDVIVPKEALVGSKKTTSGGGKISSSVFYTLNLERIIVGFATLQIARQALARAVKKAEETTDEGGQIGRRPDIKQRIARVRMRLELANLATKKATVAYDNHEDLTQMGMFANIAKYISTMAANEACDLALSLYGAEGLDKEADDIGGIYQMARLLRIAPINNEMVINFLGEHMLGMPKSYR